MKAIIFTEFAEMAKIIHRELPKSGIIIGETSIEDRNKIVDQFNNNDEFKILIGTRAIAYGLDLQAADVIIHFDLPWSCAVLEQRTSRSHRQGQKNTVFEYSLIADKTVDEYVLEKLLLKQDIAEKVMPLSEVKEMLWQD